MSEQTYDSLNIGDSYSFSRFLSKEDVRAFAELSGDDNPIHVDEDYVEKHTQFERPIVPVSDSVYNEPPRKRPHSSVDNAISKAAVDSWICSGSRVPTIGKQGKG